MIVIISSQQPKINSPIDSRFGRSAFLLKIDTESNQCDAFPNPGATQSGGAGVVASQFVIDQHVNAVISGDFGPHAATAFKAADIGMYLFTNDISTVEQAVENYKQNKLSSFK